MNVYLMYKDADFVLDDIFPDNFNIQVRDLGLDVLFQSLSAGDEFLYSVVKKACSQSLADVPCIEYRQAILRDCLYNSNIIREFYQAVLECLTMEKEKLHYIVFGHSPSAMLHQSISFTRFFLENLKKVRAIAEKNIYFFESSGMTRLLKMIIQELNEDYLRGIEEHLKQMDFKRGVLMSAKLGPGSRGDEYILREPNSPDKCWFRRIFSRRPEHYSVQIAPRDENGFRALSDLRDEGLVLVASAMAQSTEHLRNFFKSLRAELGFYVCCINLAEELNKRNLPQCFPVPVYKRERRLVFESLYDVCLGLTSDKNIVGNTLKTDNKNTFIITGANQGGKSTFLRSIGLAQIMRQSGRFVVAEYFCTDICGQIFTHYKCEEDSSMVSGKLDEELLRMRDIVDLLEQDDLVLFNESFSATNSREGADIIRGIVMALAESRVKIFFVTHCSEFACAFYQEFHPDTEYLCAERRDDGERTFRIEEGAPMDTSFGEDLYQAVFTSDELA